VIRKVGSRWVLFTRDGKRRLGTHPSRAKAEAQERLIQWKKAKAAKGG
jgi:hypothetical protein